MTELKEHLGRETGLEVGHDTYFFLGRMGSNYREYPFPWEPFRDLAGPLEVETGAIPIVVLSDNQSREKPEIREVSVPVGHYQFWVSPTCSAQSVADAWLPLLVKDHAAHGRYKGPFDWFMRDLKLKAEVLSGPSREFLSI